MKSILAFLSLFLSVSAWAGVPYILTTNGTGTTLRSVGVQTADKIVATNFTGNGAGVTNFDLTGLTATNFTLRRGNTTFKIDSSNGISTTESNVRFSFATNINWQIGDNDNYIGSAFSLSPGTIFYTATNLHSFAGAPIQVTGLISTNTTATVITLYDTNGVHLAELQGTSNYFGGPVNATRYYGLPLLTNSLGCTFSGGGSALTPGAVVYSIIPYDCTVIGAYMVGVPAGAAVIEVETCTLSAFDGGATHPVSGDKITSSTPPTITATNTKNGAGDTSLTSWSKTLTNGSILAFSVTSCTTITNLSLALRVTHSQ